MIAAILVIALVNGADGGTQFDGGAPTDGGAKTAPKGPLPAQTQMKLQHLAAAVGETYGAFIQAAATSSAPSRGRGRKPSKEDQQRLLAAWRQSAQALGEYDDYLEGHQEELKGFIPDLGHLRNSRDVMQRVLALAEQKNPYDVLRAHSKELFGAMANATAPAAAPVPASTPKP